MKKLISQAHGTAKANGFWDTERNKPEMLMLIVSEAAEALEALRKNHYADKSAVELLSDEFFARGGTKEEYAEIFRNSIKSSFEDELADVCIRLFDLCGGLNIDLQNHIQLKMAYNSTRGYKHGKAF
jgi:NTP pyrophosphatase (non-canonical NTP hydrolase)